MSIATVAIQMEKIFVMITNVSQLNAPIMNIAAHRKEPTTNVLSMNVFRLNVELRINIVELMNFVTKNPTNATRYYIFYVFV